MDNMSQQAKPAVNDLLEMDVSGLYEQLGIRAKALEQDPAVAGSFAPSVTYNASELGVLEDLQDFGKRFFDRLSGQAYSLMCGKSDDYKAERAKLQSAFDNGIDAVATALAAALVASAGIAPAIAAVVAAIAVKLFFRAGYQALCDVWKQKQPQAAGG